MITGSAFGASPAQGMRGKPRNPFLVWLVWPLITLGIYHLVWWYKINDEARKFDPRIEVNPVLSVLALFPGGIIVVPALVSIYRTGDRLRAMQASAGRTPSVVPVIGLLLAFLFSLYSLYYQVNLNGVWASYGGGRVKTGRTENFDPKVVEYVGIYSRPPVSAVGDFNLDSSVQFAIPGGWEALDSSSLRQLEQEQGRSFLGALAHTCSSSNITSHIVVEPSWPDPAAEFRQGMPLWDVAQDRAASTPGGSLAAPPIEFGVSGRFACYIPIAADGPSLYASVFIQANGRAYPVFLFTPWGDVEETLPALRTVLDTWQWLDLTGER
jgi:hypothetical protein